MNDLLSFFNFQNIVNIFVILGGVSAFIIYATQKRASTKSAFTMIINEIDAIEFSISKLRSIQAEGKLCNEEVFKSDQILTKNYWSEYKHLVMRKLDQTDVKVLDEFFYNAEQIELARSAIIKAMEDGWRAKTLAEQIALSNYIANGIESNISNPQLGQNDLVSIDNLTNTKCSMFIQAFEPRIELFTPHTPVSILVKHLSLYKAVSTSVTYKNIKRYSYNK